MNSQGVERTFSVTSTSITATRQKLGLPKNNLGLEQFVHWRPSDGRTTSSSFDSRYCVDNPISFTPLNKSGLQPFHDASNLDLAVDNHLKIHMVEDSAEAETLARHLPFSIPSSLSGDMSLMASHELHCPTSRAAHTNNHRQDPHESAPP